MKHKNVETRVFNAEDVELRVEDGEKPKIVGYAAKFNKFSLDLGGFREKIQKGAFDKVLNDDTRALKNHDANLLLGRSPKTLRLSVNAVGLRFEIDAPDTTVGRDTVEEIRTGLISGCSFAFTTEADDWKYPKDGPAERTLISVSSLPDVSVCTYPAYPDTTVAARSLDAHKARDVVINTVVDDIANNGQVRDVILATGNIEDEERTEPNANLETPDGAKTEEAPPAEEPMSAERQSEINRGYRTAERIRNRFKAANADS